MASPATLSARLQAAATKFLIVAALLVLAVGGGYLWGRRAAATSCAAKNGKAAAKVERAEDRRDLKVDAIGTDTDNTVATALARNRSSTDESADRIRTVVVPGPCRAVDPASVRELRAARDDVNAALGVGVRPGAAGADPADP